MNLIIKEQLIAKKVTAQQIGIDNITVYGNSSTITLDFSDFERMLTCMAKCEELEERVKRLEGNCQDGQGAEGQTNETNAPVKFETK